MCLGKHTKTNPITVLSDKVKAQAKKTTDTAIAENVALGNQTAATAVMGDRTDDPFGVLSRLLGISPKSVTTPQVVSAGQIGKAYGASDLRIGR